MRKFFKRSREREMVAALFGWTVAMALFFALSTCAGGCASMKKAGLGTSQERVATAQKAVAEYQARADAADATIAELESWLANARTLPVTKKLAASIEWAEGAVAQAKRTKEIIDPQLATLNENLKALEEAGDAKWWDELQVAGTLVEGMSAATGPAAPFVMFGGLVLGGIGGLVAKWREKQLARAKREFAVTLETTRQQERAMREALHQQNETLQRGVEEMVRGVDGVLAAKPFDQADIKKVLAVAQSSKTKELVAQMKSAA